MKLLFDLPDCKNIIGNELSNIVKNGIKNLYIISPYISKLDTFINISKIDNTKIICNAKSSSCNPFTLYDLLQQNNVKIKSRNDIHAKTYLLDNTALITSANATQNGLGDGTIEVASQTTDESSINEIKLWFNALWQDSQSENVSDYDDETWQTLKSNWLLQNKSKKSKQSLYDLTITGKIPNNISFTFWYEDDSAPEQSTVAKQAESIKTIELPTNANNWNFWIEEYDVNEKKQVFYSKLESLLKKYYNQTMINLKIHENTNTVYKVGNFACKLLDKPIWVEWEKKMLLLSLYRTDNINIDFTVDSKFIKLLNKSRKTNHKIWEQYKKTVDGTYGYCSREQLYKLVKNCIIKT